jgi:hypothetical protein
MRFYVMISNYIPNSFLKANGGLAGQAISCRYGTAKFIIARMICFQFNKYRGERGNGGQWVMSFRHFADKR